MKKLCAMTLLFMICSILSAQKKRARDLGVPFVGTTGTFNAITDVKGVEVGYSTMISGNVENIVGGRGSNGSGDIFLAFSTANESAFNRENTVNVQTLSNDRITPLFEATVQSVEEAIINAMIAADTMEGINGNKAYALPHDLLVEVLKKYQRIND